jgi:two-component system, OmpR family, sensor histidine kinase PhoQ
MRGVARSLTVRISLVAMAAIAVSFLATAVWLDRAFRESARDAIETRLEAQLLLLLGSVEVPGAGGVHFPQPLPDPRLALPGGGLYARILDENGEQLWSSGSMLGAPPETWTSPEVFRQGITVRWDLGGESIPLRFEVAEDRAAFQRQVEGYRRTLWAGLVVLAVLLLLGQGLALGVWGLRPLRRVRADLERLRSGGDNRLRGRYPRELAGLTEGINALLEYEHGRLERQRRALADLAHSLKTPLAALRLGLESSVEDRRSLLPQVERMQEMVRHELNRAGRMGPSPFQPALPVAPVLERTCAALQGIAAQRGLSIEQALQPDCRLRMENGAQFELFGNLLDNALRHARSRIRVTLGCRAEALLITVDDDGPGIPEALRAAVLERGVRGDSRSDGQGIGLALVHALVVDHGGQLAIRDAPELGGARIELRFAPC